MQEEGAIPDQRTFVSVFQALGMVAEKEEEVILNGQSIRAKALEKGKTMHSFTQAKGYESYNFVANTLVSMYAKCGSIRDAHIVFEGLTHQDVVSWTAMIVGYVNQNQAQEGLHLHERMIEEGVVANNVTFVSLIQACGILADMEQSVVLEGQSIKLKSLERGKTVHAVASRNGYVSDEFVCSALVNMYGKCQSILDAEIVFDGLHQRDRVLWTTMMAAYLEQGLIDCVFQLYEEMLEESLTPDKGTVVIMIQACTAFADKEVDAPGDVRFIKARSMSIGKALHAHAQRIGCHEDIVVGSTLVNMYKKCGSIADAEIAFDSSSGRNVVLWTAILAACVQLEYLDKALQLYEGMLEDGIAPNDRTFVSAIQACGMLAEKEELVFIDEKSHEVNLLNKGRTLHADAWRTGYDTDIFVGNTLISMYGKCQAIGDSWIAFTRLTNPDIVSWTAISAAYVQQGNPEKALQLYEQLQEEGLSPNDVTFVTAVHACGLLADREDDTALGWQHFKAKSLALGKAVHGHAWMKGYYHSDTLGSSVISLYGKCGSIVDAENVFYGLSKFSVAAATAMITAYAGQGKGHNAWHLFRQKQQEGVNLDETTLTCILRVCSKVGSLDVCREIHQAVASTSSAMSPEMANNLIHSYGRCASMVEAQGVFDTLPNPDVVSWTALIAGHARQGNYMSSLRCYQEMVLAGVRPNSITFLLLLSACSHAGLVDKGVEYLESMSRDYGIAPEADHYVTVVDLLGRAGYFARAEKLLSVMPPIAASTAWLCVLAACRKHGNYLLAKEAFDCAVRLDPKRSATYVMMSNIYSDLGLWDDAKVVKELRTKESAWKKPGQSWIEHEHKMHTFTVGDHNQPRWGLALDLLQYLSTARQ